MESSGWVDISVPLRTGMVVYPGDPRVQIERDQDVARGDTVTLTTISMGTHTGTHIDAPLHFVNGGRSIDCLPPTAVNGRARVIAITNEVSVDLPELEDHQIRPDEIILFKTKNSAFWTDNRFHKEYIFLSTPAARYLASKQIRAVGIDYLSIGGYQQNEEEVHKILLGASIWIIESLNLSRTEPGGYDLFCLPLKIEGAEAAPARAFLKASS
jgi:arylformamidase